MTKQKALLNALKKSKRGLTVIQVWQKIGSSQVQDLVLKLRRKGHNIICVMEQGTDRYNHPVRYGRYKLEV